jgi:hypothetical protein
MKPLVFVGVKMTGQGDEFRIDLVQEGDQETA